MTAGITLCVTSGCRSTSATDTREKPETLVHGSLASRFRARSGGGAHDQDLYSVLALDVGDRESAPWSGALVAEIGADIDGTQSRSSPFASIGDARDGSVRTRLYEAFVDHKSSDTLERARLGRQTDYATPVILTYDGLSLRSSELGTRRARFELYGGVPARFESDAQSGDLVLGASGSFRPWSDGRLRADYMHIQDDAYFGHASDDLIALDLRQQLGRDFDLAGNVSALNGAERDVRAGVTYADAQGDVVARASFYRLLETQNELSQELDPFTNILLAQFPYTQIVLMASKALGEKARAEAGFDTRHVDDQDDEGPFNRDFDRVYLTGSLDDVFSSGIDVSATVGAWKTGSDESEALELDLSHPVGAHGRASIGTAYALYEYDLFLLEERDHVRTWYVGYRYRRSAGLSWDVRYAHEASFDDYDSLRVGVTWRF